MQRICCSINDEIHQIEGLAPTMSLLHYLRYELKLRGTKEGCNEGDCGACTVILRDDHGGRARYRAVNACLVLLPMLHGQKIYTIEALSSSGQLHLVQETILSRYASQCGYCTPGIAMSLFEACYRHDMKEPWQFVEQMAGNLCRCTGYRPILDAVHALAGKGREDAWTERLTRAPLEVESLDYSHGGQRFFVPKTLEEAYAIKAEHPDCILVSGSSDISVPINKGRAQAQVYMSLCLIESLRELRVESDGNLYIGATARLADVEQFSQARCVPLARMLRYFASHQIKQIGSLGGSVAGASPVGDIAPVLSALGASVWLASAQGERQLSLDDFILGYRKTCLASDELVIAFEIPKIPDNARVASYKVSKRLELDISSVACGCYVETDAANVVTKVRLAYGGVSAQAAARAHRAEAALLGKLWSEENVEVAAEKTREDFKPISDFRASAWYRSELAANLLRGFYYETLENRQPVRLHRPAATVQLG